MKKCIYCDFFSVPYDEALVPNYITAVAHELELRKEPGGELRTIYIGGGTPTTVPAPGLIRLLRTIKDSFTVTPGAEITIEANPGTIDDEKARALSAAGVNRFSIGAQSFNNSELKLLGRVHDAADITKAITAVRHAGVRNISLDLIYGLPGQTLDVWTHTMAIAAKLSPDHISAYELTPEKGTPLYEAIARGELDKPPEGTIIEMYYRAIDTFGQAGYRHYEISNFARPGFECRHNLNYWNRGQYIGIGAGAHSFVGDRRLRNMSSIGKYIESVERGNTAIEESMEISRQEATREAVFLGLRKTEGLDIRGLKDLGIDMAEAADELVTAGLLEVNADYLRLTRKGIVVSNTVIVELFRKIRL